MTTEWKSQTDYVADEIMPLFSGVSPGLRKMVEDAIRRGLAAYQAARKEANK